MNDITASPLGVSSDNSGYKTALLLLGILFLIGAAAFAYGLATDSSALPWSFLVANFLFLLGVSQFGVAFVAIGRICLAKWARPFYRLAELITLAFLPFSIVVFLLIYRYGRTELLYWVTAPADAHLSSWLDSGFLLLRNLGAQIVFYLFALVYFFKSLAQDATTEHTQSGPGWRRALYRWLLSRKQDKAVAVDWLYRASPILLVICTIANTFMSWDFGMMLVEHYHSTVFPMYFIMGNMFAGTASILILSVVISRLVNLTSFFGTVQVKSLGIMLTGFALLWLYLFWAQFFVTWYGNMPHEFGPLWQQMYGHYAPYFWLQMICIVGIPIGTLIFAAVKRTWWSMVVIAIMMNIGVWLNRYLIVVAVTVEDHVPFSSLMEILLPIGLFAGFLLVLFWLLNAFPLISNWEVADAAEQSQPH